jgi:hypothetical protein
MAIARYGLARLVLVAAIASLLVWVGVPLLVAVLVALVAAVPLSMMLLSGLRRDLSAALSEAGARRSAQRARLRAQLRGDTEPGPAASPGEDEPRGGEDRPGEHDQTGLAEHRDEVAPPGPSEDGPHR